MRTNYKIRKSTDYIWEKLDAEHIKPTHPIKNTTLKGWQSKAGTIIQQTFDARYGLLYYYEFSVLEPFTITFIRKKGDINLLYPLQYAGVQLDFKTEASCVPIPIDQEAFYLYSPKGEYEIRLPVGHHIIVGFIIDAGVVRPPASRAYDFITPLNEAKRSKSPLPLQSPSFKIGPLTMKILHNLFQSLRPREIRNEAQFLSYIIYLIELSRLKLMHAAEKEQIHQPNKLIQHARKLLKLSIQSSGAKALLSDIAESLEIPLWRLSHAHQKYYKTSFLTYRNELLLKYVIQHIQAHDKMIEAALNCGFAGIAEMNRFLKRQTGKSSGFYK